MLHIVVLDIDDLHAATKRFPFPGYYLIITERQFVLHKSHHIVTLS